MLTPRPIRVDVVRPDEVAGEGLARVVEAATGVNAAVVCVEGGPRDEATATGAEEPAFVVADVLLFVATEDELWKLLTGTTIVVTALEDSEIVRVVPEERDDTVYYVVSL